MMALILVVKRFRVGTELLGAQLGFMIRSVFIMSVHRVKDVFGYGDKTNLLPDVLCSLSTTL